MSLEPSGKTTWNLQALGRCNCNSIWQYYNKKITEREYGILQKRLIFGKNISTLGSINYSHSHMSISGYLLTTQVTID